VTAIGWDGANGRLAAPREFVASVTTIMVKELRSRMRGRRAFVVLTVYLGLLALIAYGVYAVIAPSARSQAAFGFGGPTFANASAIIGQTVFSAISIFQLILVCFIAPAFTSGQISMEREKQTLDLLISTPLRPGAIVVGKLLAALAFVGLMIVAAVPISAIVLMYGGASIDDIVRQQVVLLATALGFGAVGLFFSALLKRTQAATVLTYCTVLALGLGTVMLFIFWTVLANSGPNGFGQLGPTQRAPEQIVYFNPMVGMLDVVANTEPGGGGGIASALNQLRNDPAVDPNLGGFGQVCQGNVCFAVDQNGNPVADRAPIAQAVGGYFWPRFVITFVAFAVLLTLFSMRLVIPAPMRFAFRRRRKDLPPLPEGPMTTGSASGQGGTLLDETPRLADD
jgi:ABC-type transport system involved in multi-copper enzyme maturation permease subunit